MTEFDWALCEWDPVRNEPAGAVATAECGCRNKATVRVGAKGEWHLCASCARLPRFNKYKVRVPYKG